MKDTFNKLHSSQKNVFFDQIVSRNNPKYNIGCYFRLIGKIDEKRLIKAITSMVEEHDIFRTYIFQTDQEPFLGKREKGNNAVLQVEDLTGFQETAELAKSWIDENFRQPIDIFSDFLWEHKLFKLSEGQYWYYFKAHHIVIDAYSILNFIKVVAKKYNVTSANTELPSANSFIEQIAHDKAGNLSAVRLARASDYWQRKFENKISSFLIRKRFNKNEGEGHTESFTYKLSSFQQTNLLKLEGLTGVNLQNILIAALTCYYSRIRHQSKLIFGIPIHNRNNLVEDQVIGMFAKINPFFVELKQSHTVISLLKEIRNNRLEDYRFNYYPQEYLRQDLKQAGYQANETLYEIIVNSLSFHVDHIFEGVETELVKMNSGRQLGILELCWIDRGPQKATELRADYLVDFFSETEIVLLMERLLFICDQFALSPERLVTEIDILPQAEKQLILRQFNDTKLAFDDNMTILALFKQQVENRGDDIAVCFQGESMTYRDLNTRSNQLGAYLQHLGVKGESVVPIYLEKGFSVLVAIFGVLKVGGAYVPLDPSYPKDRIGYIIEDINPKVILTAKRHIDFFERFNAIQIVDLDGEYQRKQSFNAVCEPQIESDQLAYIIYTSGSTGKPKGVMIEHRGLLNFFFGMDERLGIKPQDHLLSITSISFDISILELLWTTCRGILLTIPDDTELTGFNRYLTPRTNKLALSLFYFTNQVEVEEHGKYDFLLETVKFADKNGFSGVWLPERHFNEFGGIFPSPAVIAASLATVTTNIELRAGSVVLPLHDVIRVAEDWSVVDNLSKGRVALSVAPGWHGDDFALMPQNFADKHTSMYKKIEELKVFWSGEKLRRTNGYQRDIDVTLFPNPITKTLPLWITAAGNPETFRRAGEMGCNLLTHLLGQKISDLKERIAIYKEALVAAGHKIEDRKIALMLHTYVGDSEDEVRETVEAPFKAYLRTSINILQSIAGEIGVDINDLKEDQLDPILDNAFNRYWKTNALFGTMDFCRNFLNNVERIGVTEIACLIDFGIAKEKITKSLKRLTLLEKKKSSTVYADRPVNTLQITPSYLSPLLDDIYSDSFFKHIDHLIVGGESFSQDLLRKARDKGIPNIFNVYGPTETTIWSTVKCLTESDHLTIGNPIANTSIYILDDRGSLCPIGEEGELYIAGRGVARGYWNKDELTKERFIPDTFSGVSTDVMYRTGDMARWTATGEIEFLGRRDNQVKIRGYRIDLGEIEQVMLESKMVKMAVVVARDNRQLIAYVSPAKNYDESSLRVVLRDQLPDYMIPTKWVTLKDIPLTSNGKVDRKTLTGLEEHERDMDSQFARNALDQLLLDIWENVIGKKGIRIHDNFFEVGGDSIIAIQIVNKVRNQQIEIQVKHIYDHPTVADLSNYIASNTYDVIQAEQGLLKGPVGLLPIQHWYLDKPNEDVSHYNQSICIKIDKSVNHGLLYLTVELLLTQHDALRCNFQLKEGKWYQNYDGVSNSLIVEDISGREDIDLPCYLEEFRQEQEKTLSIFDGTVTRFAHLVTPSSEDSNFLVIVIHHLVVDGVSWRILLDDLYTLLDNLQVNHTYKLPLKTSSSREWYAALEAYSQTTRLQSQKEYWQQVERNYSPLKVDHPAGEMLVTTVKTMGRIRVSLDSDLTYKLLIDVPKIYKTHINDLLITVLFKVLYEWSGCKNINIGMEGHGREDINNQIDTVRSVGWFTSLFPIALQKGDFHDLDDWINYVKELLKKIPDNGIGYGVLKYMCREPSLFVERTWDVMFNYLGKLDNISAPQDSDENFSWLKGGLDFRNSMSERHHIREKLLLNIVVQQNKMDFEWTYSKLGYSQSTIATLVKTYMEMLEEVINHCLASKGHSETSSNHDLDVDITMAELRSFNNRRKNGNNVMEF